MIFILIISKGHNSAKHVAEVWFFFKIFIRKNFKVA